MYIYLVTNVVNGKVYVGQTTGTIKERWSCHRRDARRDSPFPLHRAIRKYGIKSFDISVLAECFSKSALDAAERLFIQKYNACDSSFGYNATFGGDGGKWPEGRKQKQSGRMLGNTIRRGSTMPEESRKMISKSLTGQKRPGRKLTPERKAEISRQMTGRTMSAETIERMSLARKKHFTPEKRAALSKTLSGRVFSDEHCANLSKAMSGRTRQRSIELQENQANA